MREKVYFGKVRLYGEENARTLATICNYAMSLVDLRHLEKAKSLTRRTIPISRRVNGEEHPNTFALKCFYAQSIYRDNRATLDDLREAVTTLEEIDGTARRGLDGSHPIAVRIDECLRQSRATLHIHEVISK